MIITLQLAPGVVLSEYGLSELLEIGRTPIREALQRLAGEGLVVVLPSEGFLFPKPIFAPNSDCWSCEGKCNVFSHNSQQSGQQRRRGRILPRSALLCFSAASARDEGLFAQLDRELDECMWKAARNEFITKTMALMRGLSRRFWFEHYRRVGDLPLAATLHSKWPRR